MDASALGARGHDSLQYHVICADSRIFAARVFQTTTTTVQWAWIYRDGEARVVLDCDHPVSLSMEGPLRVSSPLFTVAGDAEGGSRLEVGRSVADGFAVAYVAGQELSGSGSGTWEPQRHYWLPDLRCAVDYQGERFSARCFAKRYTWQGNAPRYWAYRMFSGFADADGFAVWSADALFEDIKHGNFKLLSQESGLWSGDVSRTFHGDMAIRTEGEGREICLTMTPLGRLERIIHSGAMDSRLVQWPVAFTISDSTDGETSGHGIYEYVCGTLG